MFDRCSACGRPDHLKRNLCEPCYRAKKRREYRARKTADPFRNWITRSVAAISSRAKRKDLPFDLTRPFLTSQARNQGHNCWYCGQKLGYAGGLNSPEQASVDRVIPSKGYVVGNVVLACALCNRRKADSSVEDLVLLIQGLVRFLEAGQSTEPPSFPAD